MSETNQIVVVPHIENTIPIPKNNAEALPDMTSEEEIQARTNTIKLLSDITDEVIEPTTEDIEQAEELAKEMMINPDIKPEFGNYPNETMAYLAGMVAQTNCMLVKDMADFKLHVVGAHHARLAKIFEDIAAGKKKRVIVNIAPRHG
jgi:hypothetical protein